MNIQVKRIPQIDKILRSPYLSDCLDKYKRPVILRLLRDLIQNIKSGNLDELTTKTKDFSEQEISEFLIDKLKILTSSSIMPVINATGVVLNTNLGRAPIDSRHLESLVSVASGYCNLEYDLTQGKRGRRSKKISELIVALTGAEAACVVNNNAAAIMLAVNCFALAKEVIVSRGELIEIGGSFRLPELIVAAGACLKEVGTTNKTKLEDYRKAIGPNTGLILRCHPSNFELRGFTERVPIQDLVKIAQENRVPLLDDLGSGALYETAKMYLPAEPTVEATLDYGCDLVSFSGDKLLAGPQAGILAGKAEFITKLNSHPLYRALRLDKTRLFLLEKALIAQIYNDHSYLLPAQRFIQLSAEEIKNKITDFNKRMKSRLRNIKLEISPVLSTIGGGALPGSVQESFALNLISSLKANHMSKILRESNPPVISIIRDEQVLLDFRTVSDREETLLESVILNIDNKLSDIV